MVTPSGDVPPNPSLALLASSVSYAMGAAHMVDPDGLAAPTPCAGWDVSALLEHVSESLAQLSRCLDADPDAPAALPTSPTDRMRAFRTQCAQLIGALTCRRARPVVIARGYPLTIGLVATTGAVEVAVRGWDLWRAVHRPKAIPAALAARLLGLCPVLVADACHHQFFAPPITVRWDASPSDRLVATLGRHPFDPSFLRRRDESM